VTQIEKAGYKMLEMLNNSLNLYKMETGVYQYQPDTVDILSVLQKNVAETKQMADSLNLVVEIRLSGKLVTENDTFTIKGEQLLCYSMFANLLKNAIEASPNEASITVSIEESKDVAIISIHNQGAIPLEIRENFFDKYVTAKKYGGTGLGTYSAKLMAEIQGGTIQFNTSEDTGTTIMVQLLK
jgi:signal transduction histidine kinase